VWRAVVESGECSRGFDSSGEAAWLPCVSVFAFPDDRTGEARAKLLALAGLADWLALRPTLDPESLPSVESLLGSVRELRAMVDELAGSLEALRVDLSERAAND